VPRILTVNDRTPAVADALFVADDVTIAGDVRLAPGVSVWFGSVLRSERSTITIGRDSNVQDLTVIHTDEGRETRLGERVTVGHRVILHGCVIDDDALIGMGATILNGAHVGAGAIVGANALIPEGMHVPENTLAVGVPARLVDKELPPLPRPNVASYLALAEAYRDVPGA
jgi:carbonic anhydrase/acetyltransferase-like protein (isoleucine patch superfamily)